MRSHAGIKVLPLHQCVGPKCKAPADRIVTLWGNYPQKVCGRHESWAKARVIEIDES